MSEEFDWSDNPDVLFAPTGGLAVYENVAGGVALRQTQENGPDVVIAIPYEQIFRLVTALNELNEARTRKGNG